MREAYAPAVTLQPKRPASRWGYAHVLKTLGDQAGSLRAYRAAIAAKPDFGEVYWSMANLKVFRFDDAEVAAMEEQLERSDLAAKRGHPFPVRARQGVEDARRL